MVMTSGDQEILLSLEHDSQGFTIARAGDNVAIAFQETDAYQVMSREENALAGNQFHKMLSMLGESESKVDNP
ncbi:BnaA03g19760D [Brassica napus]|uniref:BnaA03g19760D protein n=2 Tax=Brassica napus TaxID=3708 RepID=A0A078HD68_BRANA|nr:BnaA03g19760D [Brassica napus]